LTCAFFPSGARGRFVLANGRRFGLTVTSVIIAACGARSQLDSETTSSQGATSGSGGIPIGGTTAGGIGAGGSFSAGGNFSVGGAFAVGGSFSVGGSNSGGASFGGGGAVSAGGSSAVDAGACRPAGTACLNLRPFRPCCEGLVCGPDLRCVESCSPEGSDCSGRLRCCGGLDCRSDGVCDRPRTCDSVAAEAAAFLAERQSCSTVAECTEFLNPQGPELPGEFCCNVPVRVGASLTQYESLLAEWVSLGCEQKEACCNGDATMDCIGGQCVWR
jgi:hypothetical protein